MRGQPLGAAPVPTYPAADFAAQEAFTPWTALWNLTGQPAVSLPLHVTGDGLPVGVMLAGRPAGEAGLLSLAAQVEEAAGTVWTTGGGARPAERRCAWRRGWAGEAASRR